jgi:hypothetical protein
VSGALLTDGASRVSMDAPERVFPKGDATLDTGGPADAGVDAIVPVDAPVKAGDAGVDAACTPSTPVATVIGDCNIPECCKFEVAWTCGNADLEVSGGCQATTGGYVGNCTVNGSIESMFSASATSCLCHDGGALATYVQSLCEVSPPPTPP